MNSRAAHGGRALLLPATILSALAVGLVLATACADRESPAPAPARQALPPGLRSSPGPSLADEFRPGFDPLVDELPRPTHGGNATLHTPSLPASVNFMIDNSASARRMLYELHATLVLANWETWELEPVLAESFWAEDRVTLKSGVELFERSPAARGTTRTLVDAGGEAVEVAPDDVERIEERVGYTFRLRTDVLWHDGHVFDLRDVLFTLESYKNPHVACDAKRYIFDKIERADTLDENTIRFVFEKPHFLSASFFGESFVILPSHLYDLADADNDEHDPAASAEEQGKFVNEHPNNLHWIGLGPYKVTAWAPPFVRAERFRGYFDARNGGWLDTVQWRAIPDDEAAVQALLNRELDYFERLSAERFVGSWSEQPAFGEHFYKGSFYTPYMSFTAWNTRRAPFDDARVRRALNQCFDWPEFIQGHYRGLAFRVTWTQAYSSPTYDKSIAPIEFDLEEARAGLAEAGWYDRDGDGLVDKDGEALVVDFHMMAGDRTTGVFVQKFQENLERVGVTLRDHQSEWSDFFSRANDSREFDAVNLGWLIPLRTDPEHLWHSRRADQPGSQFSGLKDAEVDRLIDSIQDEPDDGARVELFHQLHRRIHDLQPFMFHIYAPRKFALSKRIRNFQTFASDPGYSIRRWYVVE